MSAIIMGTLGAFFVAVTVQWIMHERDLREFERDVGIRDGRKSG